MGRMPCLAIARSFLVALLLPGPLLVSGCQPQGDLPPTHPVSGKVVYKDGTPMKGGVIQFGPVSDESSILVSGEIDENGGFTLYTTKDKQKKMGAAEGQYEITIVPPQGGEHQPAPPFTLPETYTIKAGESTIPTKIGRAHV